MQRRALASQLGCNTSIRFLDAYKSHGVDFWGLTTQNEPTDGFIPGMGFNALGFTAEMQRDFVKLDLGPTLAAAGYGLDKLQLMIMDDNRGLLPAWVDTVLNDADAAKYVSGIAYHWYANFVTQGSVLDATYKAHPTYFMLSTEACEGWMDYMQKIVLGSWERAETYAADIIDDLQRWGCGWVDWNMALDLGGGPNWANNFVDSPVIVNATANEFYKNPMFYALGHFSKFLTHGSVRVDWSAKHSNWIEQPRLPTTVFRAVDGATIVVVLNPNDFAVNVEITDVVQSAQYSRIVSPRSIVTFRN